MTLKYRARVRIVGSSNDYTTPRGLVGRCGHAVDRDGALILVYLDEDPNGPRSAPTQYWAFPSEIEEITVESQDKKL